LPMAVAATNESSVLDRDLTSCGKTQAKPQ
jgi:hypothetical protein